MMKGIVNHGKLSIKHLAFLLLVVLLTNLIASCSGATATTIPNTGPVSTLVPSPTPSNTEGAYYVVVTDPNGNGVELAKVTLLYEGGTKSALSDSFGSALFMLPYNLLGKPVEIVVEKDGANMRMSTTISFQTQRFQFSPEKPGITPTMVIELPVVPTDLPTQAAVTETLTSAAAAVATTATVAVKVTCDGIFSALPVFRTPLTRSGVVSGTFVLPTHCSTGIPASETLNLSGTLSSVPQDRHFWVLGYSTNERYYPQCMDPVNGLCVTVAPDGRWSSQVWVGEPGCKEDVHLVLVSVDQAGHNALLAKMREWGTANNYPGLDTSELPQELQEVDSIEIETVGNNC